MPFNVKEENKDIYPDPDHWSKVYKHIIRRAVVELGWQCHREDEGHGTRSINRSILKNIKKADIILCDLSSYNYNVFYELGVAVGLRKKIVVIFDEEPSRLPFDVSGIHVVQYHRSFDATNVFSSVERIKHSLVETEEKGVDIDMHADDDASSLTVGLGGDFPTSGLCVLREADRVIRNIEEIISNKNGKFSLEGDIISIIEEYIKDKNIVNRQDIQVNLLDRYGRYLYHDWLGLRGKQASHKNISGHDVFEALFNKDISLVFWEDEGSNKSSDPSVYFRRFNIGISKILCGTEFRLVLEIHFSLDS